MVEVRSSIPLLRFCAGHLQLGMAAEDVLQVTPETWAGDLHIASILGVEPLEENERRTIRLPTTERDGPDRPALCSFQADMPLEVIECEVENILSMPAGIPATMWRPVMGFVEISQTIILLLDIPSVVSALLSQYRRATS